MDAAAGVACDTAGAAKAGIALASAAAVMNPKRLKQKSPVSTSLASGLTPFRVRLQLPAE
jgi:hypothetical protein